MDDILSASESRKQRRTHRLGGEKQVCSACCEADQRCLEMHHIAGQKYLDDVVPICRNCHRKLSDDQKDHPDTENANIPAMAAMGQCFLGLADFLDLIVKRLREWGRQLIDWAQHYVLVPEAELAR